jgi:hypothetical protein
LDLYLFHVPASAFHTKEDLDPDPGITDAKLITRTSSSRHKVDQKLIWSAEHWLKNSKGETLTTSARDPANFCMNSPPVLAT